jgi:glutathione S-transferase
MTIILYELAGADPDRRFSPFCWRSRLALAHKDLPTEGVPWRFWEQAVLAPTGQARVPVIVDSGRWVNDSWAIADYLEDTYPDRPSLFGGASGRAAARFIGNWADTTVHPALGRLIMLDIWKQVDDRDKAYFRQSREARYGMTLEQVQEGREGRLAPFRQLLQPLRLTIEKQPFLGGERPLYADYIAMGAFLWARGVSGFTLLEADDPIHAWRQRMLDLFDGLAAKATAFPV